MKICDNWLRARNRLITGHFYLFIIERQNKEQNNYFNSRNQKKTKKKNAENFKYSNWKQFGTIQDNSNCLVDFQFEKRFEVLLFLRWNQVFRWPSSRIRNNKLICRCKWQIQNSRPEIQKFNFFLNFFFKPAKVRRFYSNFRLSVAKFQIGRHFPNQFRR